MVSQNYVRINISVQNPARRNISSITEPAQYAETHLRHPHPLTVYAALLLAHLNIANNCIKMVCMITPCSAYVKEENGSIWRTPAKNM